MSVKGTQTEKNLLQSFAGESQARNRYTFFAKQAKKDGYEQIAAIFEETARQEEEHAKMFFRALEGGMVEITASFPAGQILDTQSNLEAAANGENEEWTAMYKEMARTYGLAVTGGSDTHFRDGPRRVGVPEFYPSAEVLRALKIC